MLGVGLLWRADLRTSSIVDPCDLQRSADRAWISSAMPEDIGDAINETDKLKREYAATLRRQEEDWQGANKRYVEEAARHIKVNLQLFAELGRVKDRLSKLSAEKEESEKDTRAREAELAEKVARAKYEVTITLQAHWEAECKVTALGSKVQEMDGEVKRAKEAVREAEARARAVETRVAMLCKEHEKELNVNAKEFEERLEEAYGEHDSVVAYLEGRVEQAKRLYEVGFVLGFKRARTQVELLEPAFDIGLLDQEKIVQDGVLVPDPEWGFGMVEGEEEASAVELEQQGLEVGQQAGGVAEPGAKQPPMGDVVPVVSEGDCPGVSEVQHAVEGGQLAVEGDQPAVEGDHPAAELDPDVVIFVVE